MDEMKTQNPSTDFSQPMSMPSGPSPMGPSNDESDLKYMQSQFMQLLQENPEWMDQFQRDPEYMAQVMQDPETMARISQQMIESNVAQPATGGRGGDLGPTKDPIEHPQLQTQDIQPLQRGSGLSVSFDQLKGSLIAGVLYLIFSQNQVINYLYQFLPMSFRPKLGRFGVTVILSLVVLISHYLLTTQIFV